MSVTLTVVLMTSSSLNLIFFGVLGGALTFGFLGVFLGPTLLAVGYNLVVEWATASKLMEISESEKKL